MNVMSKTDDIAKRPHSLTPLNEDRRMRYYPIVRNWSRIHRMLQTTALETHVPLVAKDDVPDDESREAYDETSGQSPSVVVYRISGAFFFSAAASIGTVLERIGDAHRNLIIDFAAVPFVDSTGAKTDGRQDHRGSGAQGRAARRRRLPHRSFGWGRELAAQGVRPPLVNNAVSIDQALAEIRSIRPAPGAPAVAS
jgi:sulfate permease, SulP family